MKRRHLAACLALLLTACPVPVTVGRQFGTAPHMLYTDVVSGPTRGGEGDQGAYLSIFGRHFGTDLSAIEVRIGGHRVAKLLSLGPSKGRADVQQLTVQVGSLEGATGTLPIEVQVSAQPSNTDFTFTVQPGDTLFVDNVSGNDATAVKNDLTHPFRTLQTSTGGGALGQARAGDVIILRGKATWSDVGLDNRWAHLGSLGSAPTGQPGTGPLTIQAYPGEDVHFVPSPGTRGGLHGATTAVAATWVVISGLRIEGGDSSVTDGPIVLQIGSDHWRVVNNDVGPWAAGASATKSGGISGDGAFIALIGNHVHDFTGGQTNCIGLDDGTKDADVSWNWLTGCRTGSGVQTFMSFSSNRLERISIHHNLIRDTARASVLIGEGTLSAHVWNNELADSDGAGLRISQSVGVLNTVVEHNTFSQPCRLAAALNAAVLNTSSANAGTVRIANNVFLRGPSSTCPGYLNDGIDSAFAFERNAWSTFTAPTADAFALGGDLAFTGPNDFHLASTSALIDAARNSTILDDVDGEPRSGTPDLGAYEYLAPAPTAPIDLGVGCAAAPSPTVLIAALIWLRRKKPE